MRTTGNQRTRQTLGHTNPNGVRKRELPRRNPCPRIQATLGGCNPGGWIRIGGISITAKACSATDTSGTKTAHAIGAVISSLEIWTVRGTCFSSRRASFTTRQTRQGCRPSKVDRTASPQELDCERWASIDTQPSD